MHSIVSLLKSVYGFFFKTKTRSVIVIIIIVAFVAWNFFVSGNGDDVETTVVQSGIVKDELILTGVIKADEHTSLKFQNSGKVTWLGVADGDEVLSGQDLIRLDTTNLSQDLKIADANLRAKAASLDKVYDDLQGKEDSETFEEKDTRTTAEANKDSAVYSNIKAQNNLGNLTLKAPFDGIVSFIANPFTGANVLFSEPQIELVNPDTIYFEVTADQSEVINLKLGQSVTVVLDSFLENDYEGIVEFISYTPKSNEVGTSYRVKVRFPGEIADVEEFRIGMSGDAKFLVAEKENVLWAPPKFINSDTKGKYVNTNKNNNKVYIKVGIEGENRVEIISDDISKGDTIYD